MRAAKQKALLAFAAAYAIWGFNAPMIKISLQSLPLFPLVFFKFVIGGIFFTVLARKQWKRVPGRYVWRIGAATLIGYTLTTLLVYQGISETGGLNASLIYLIAPLLVYVLSIEILKDKFSGRLLFGVVAGLLGALLIIAAPLLTSTAGDQGSLTGNVLVVLAAITDALSVVIIKPLLQKTTVMQMTAMRFNIAALSLLPFAIVQLHALGGAVIDLRAASALAFNLIAATIVAYYLYHYGLSRISAEQTSPLYYLDPMVGAVASLFILNEQLSAPVLLGVLLVLVGIYFSEVKTKNFAWRFSHHR